MTRLLSSFSAFRGRQQRKPAHFTLLYDGGSEVVTVGHLTFDQDTWTFVYDGEYKRRPDLRPLEGFDDLERVYRSSVLFPFFAVRVPDPDRGDIRRQLDQDRIKDPQPTDLLRLFGRRVVSSPGFELVPA
ncbi:MAG: HipA N-terminal domain-containing protein [Vicinamibacterales bacterium]